MTSSRGFGSFGELAGSTAERYTAAAVFRVAGPANKEFFALHDARRIKSLRNQAGGRRSPKNHLPPAGVGRT